MKTKRLLLELVELLDSFEATVPNADEMGLDAFLSYALSLRLDQQQEEVAHTPNSDEATIAQMLSLLYRVSRHYTKKAFQERLFNTEEEYSYLVSLLSAGRLTKTELNTRNALERSTGNEMLRRLARLGLVIEMDDPVDKRQKLVQLTPLGRTELMKVFPDLREVTQLLTHTLDSWQKLYLRNLLSQMTARHLTLMRDLKDVPITDYLDEVNRKGKSPEL